MTTQASAEAAWKLLQEMAADAEAGPTPPMASDSPDGFLTRTDRWGIEHSAAALGMTKAAVAALDGPPSRGPLALAATILETQQAFIAAETDGPDRLLALQKPLVVDSSEGSSRWTLLTAMSDRIATVEDLLGPVAARPHYRKSPPPVGILVTEIDRPELLADALGTPLRDLLDASENPDPAVQARALFGPWIPKVTAVDATVGAALQWVVDNDAAAFMTLPITEPLRAMMAGQPQSAPLAAQFAHVVELGPLGYGVFIWWDTEAGGDRALRAHLAGYIRYLYDHYVAPWNRWDDIRIRREALCVYAVLADDRRLQARRLAARLHELYPDAYVDEDLERTVQRLYRRSRDLGGIYIPASVRSAALSEGAADQSVVAS